MQCRALVCIFLPLALAACAAPVFADNKPETPHLAFVTEYVRELAASEEVRETGERELKRDPKSNFSILIHTGTLFQLELRSQITILRDMRLNAPYDDLIPNITAFYESKIDLWQKLKDSSSAFLVGPKPGVDYDKLAAAMPEIRAQLDFIDKALFEATPLVFAALIDERPDSKNHASHLIITKAERAKLILDLKTDFGAKLSQKNQNYSVGAAGVLNDYLLKKNYKASDEPWE